MSFFMEVLENKNVSAAKVTGRFPQKLLPGQDYSTAAYLGGEVEAEGFG